jgi:regulator of sigma E protease
MHEIRIERQPGEGFAALGAENADLYVGAVLPGSAAEKVGIRRGDRLLTLNGKPILGREWFRLAVERARDAPVELTWKSGDEVKSASIRRSKVESQDEMGQKVQVVHLGLDLGVDGESSIFALPQPENVRHRLGAWDSLRESVQILPIMIAKTATIFAYLLSGRLPLEMVGGPIAIYQEAGRSAAAGLDKFLETMALLSVNLGIVNLLPIPILDGFQLLAAGWEGVRRRPIPMRAREIANMIGLAMLFILMVIAFRNDLMR